MRAYPDAWIEIAYANPAAGGGLQDRRAIFRIRAGGGGRLRGAEEQERLQHLCRRRAAAGRDASHIERRASGENVLTACRAWTDFDGEGDAARVEAILKDKDIQPAEVVTTGTIPHRRFQVHFELLGKPSEDGLDPAIRLRMT